MNAPRLVRVLVFAAAAAPAAVLALDFLAGALATPYRTILHETGLWSMRLLSLGLLLSPLARFTGVALFNVPRRMLGLFAAFYAFVHAWAWCRQYGYDWSFLLAELPRAYLLLGLLAVLMLVPLVATSNAAARTRMGEAWARLHQLAYAIALAALLHFMLSRALPPRESWIHLALVGFAIAHRRAAPVHRAKRCPLSPRLGYGRARGMSYTFNFRDIWAQTDFILEGVGVTLQLSVITMIAGLGIGTAGAAASVYGPRWLKAIVAAYVEVIRNTPLIVQLFLVFFGLPSAGVRLDAMTASVIALAINLGAYSTEIIRAGLEAIPRAQLEAGASLGLSGPQVFRHIVLFPAVKIVYPALTSQYVLVMLATSVVSQISAPDLFHVASIIQSRTFRDFEIYAVVAGIYLALALAFKLLFAAIHRLAFARR